PLLSPACGRREPPPPRVAASIFPLYDIVRRVAARRLEVDLVLPPGHTTHSFDPRPQDVAKLANAQIVFAVGLGLDTWVTDMAKNAGVGEGRVFNVGPLVDPILVPEGVLRLAEGDGAGQHGRGAESPIDPHFWLDPVRAARATDVVVAALQKLDPEEAPFYRIRGDDLKRSLDALHGRIGRRSSLWTHRTLVTFHGSLYYYADRYHLDVAAVVEAVPGREPTARYMADLLEVIRKAGVVALFSEPQLDPRAARAIAGEAGLPVHEIDPVGGSPGVDTYEKVLDQVTDVLDKTLR
ncbi:MAG TPA: metal ABC transporter substrate-binding protein, partial [Vicinamibacteria bacterium]|nr:metal ABC transporter substrate-binding protein [Vicinamibacteria bacterium]